jgi:heme/copper-type cytochrome/quinol oxidase subunit 3
MNVRDALDVSQLPVEEYGHKDTLYWGMLGLFLMEGMNFALLVAAYFHLRMRHTQWPPGDAGLPDFTYALPNVLLMLAVCYPMRRIDNEAPDRPRIWLAKMLAVCAFLIAVCCVLRILEFGSLQTDYFESSYGSVVWALLFLHGMHLLTQLGEASLLAVYCATHSLDRKHRADVEVNAMYWYFVAALGVVNFATIWLAGRVL